MKSGNDALIVEMFLRVWEDVCFREHMAAVAANRQTEPAFENAPSFRDYLLQYRPGDVFDEKRFIPSHDPNIKLATGVMAAAPALIASWVSGSKRIFRLSAEMQARFETIGFGNLRLSDVLLPFPTFGIQLATPLQDSREKNGEYRFMFVWSSHLAVNIPLQHQQSVNFVLLPDVMRGYGGLDPLKRNQAQKAFLDPSLPYPKRMRIGKTLDELLVAHKKMYENSGPIGSMFAPSDALETDTLIEDFFAEYKEKIRLHDVYMRQARIALNLCLYLQSLPSSAETEKGTEWKAEYLPKRDLKAPFPVITKRTEVCDIVGHHIIDAMVINKRSSAARAGGWEMEPRWRRAHTRRPPGKGSDPTAEKSVKVRHYLIREDLVAQGRLVQGSLAEVR